MIRTGKPSVLWKQVHYVQKNRVFLFRERTGVIWNFVFISCGGNTHHTDINFGVKLELQQSYWLVSSRGNDFLGVISNLLMEVNKQHSYITKNFQNSSSSPSARAIVKLRKSFQLFFIRCSYDLWAFKLYLLQFPLRVFEFLKTSFANFILQNHFL